MVSGWWCTRQRTAQEGFDADHVAVAADRAIAQGPASESLVTVAVVFHRVGYSVCGSHDAEQPAAGGEPGSPVAIGEPPVTADALEAVGRHMQQKAANEFVGLKRHGLRCGGVFIVFPPEGNVAVVEADEPVVRDGHTVGVAAQIVEYVSGIAEGRLRVDDPLGLCGRCEKGVERLNVGERFKLAVEMECAGVKGMAQLCEKQTPEQPREHPHGQEETGATGDPVFPVRGDATARDHTVDVRMVLQALPPGMQDRDEADFGAQVFRIGGDGAQGFGAGAEQGVVDHAFVLPGERRDRFGQREDHVEILDLGQQLSLPVFKPLRAGERLALRAGPMPARVVGDALVTAGVALFDMAAEGRGAAQFDRAHGTPLGTAEPAGMTLPVLRPAAAEDIRHLECRTHDGVQKYSGGLGGGCSGPGCGSRSKGLEVAQMVLVATFKYLAVVERERCPISNWILRTSVPLSSK